MAAGEGEGVTTPADLASCPLCGTVRQLAHNIERNRPCTRCRVSTKPPPDAWAERAACRGHAVLAPDAWWPIRSNYDTDPITAAALEVCAECPVRAECLEHALAVGEGDGIWGGLTPPARRAEARSRRQRREARYMTSRDQRTTTRRD